MPEVLIVVWLLILAALFALATHAAAVRWPDVFSGGIFMAFLLVLTAPLFEHAKR
jgi:hypothetical protein